MLSPTGAEGLSSLSKHAHDTPKLSACPNDGRDYRVGELQRVLHDLSEEDP